MMQETTTGRLQIGDSVIYQKLNDEVVLLNMDNQQYFGLDDVGAAMWDSILQHGDPEVAAAKLQEVYKVDPATLRSDVEALVRSLLAAELLKYS